ncbi:MAG: DUF1971 domain-containing protein [Rhodospirillaceae bacterium]|jgi:tellurite methyltransferase|nr:DUF1971 domain-containing protein [Rhodospirillaceae bacterium]MBT5195806.1 DUF1971 domain-containing protein [Rhodospirillaceae bacterium]MBT5457426.1 DUF1971 domain-containing protein [Rhodospirillaceae bacterium]MBT5895600.1 DUF1971 domain-containing protein [Rhodospirillaceae bacterium]MBT7755875.1 DUF1971 domain-containing protein [Rhodospirillaceae bacterium]
MEQKTLPSPLKAYRRTPVFTEDTIPKGLRNEHSTKPGVWGVIHVMSGTLLYTIDATGHSQTLTSGQTGLIEPDQLHHVTPRGAVSFFVEFWK